MWKGLRRMKAGTMARTTAGHLVHVLTRADEFGYHKVWSYDDEDWWTLPDNLLTPVDLDEALTELNTEGGA